MSTQNEVEALLFSSGKAMSEEQLAVLTKKEIAEIKKALLSLQKHYEKQDTALALYEENNHWKLNVREQYSRLVRKIIADVELNKSILKTLATIAWKSPVMQAEIIKIRGNKAYDHIAELETLGFVNKEAKSRSYLVKTTPKFSDYFDVSKKGEIKKAFENVKQPTMPEQQEELPITPQDIVPPPKRDPDTEFLEQIEKKINDVKKKNDTLEQDQDFNKENN